ncbi:GAF domain-containing protein [Pacificibacter marinus]|uniref:GAF domain protein n=2 Tax=Pacificibacter marinus TaxID=658057 RepID=A0A1Y5RN53_9RHOB|nr:GAF domain-containing protein [Pacificibacter marinus]SLN20399.1 GAF domain protein [Pacificibacter marinus]
MFEVNDPDVVALVGAVRDAVQSSGVVVWVSKPGGLHIVAHSGKPVQRPLDRVLQPRHTIGHLVTDMDRMLVCDDTLSHPLLAKSGAVREMGIMAYIGVPFHVGQAAVGGISAVHQHARRWDEADITCVKEAARRLSDLAQKALG